MLVTARNQEKQTAMELSRSEKKRQAKQVEELAHELVALSATDIRRLPCEPFLQEEILAARTLKGGAYKRQVKYVARELRELDIAPLFDFLQQRRGSQLKEKQQFHALELLRESIITDVLRAAEAARAEDLPLADDWPSPALEQAASLFPNLDVTAVRTAAAGYARNRKATYSREIFRILKAAQERQLFAERSAAPRPTGE